MFQNEGILSARQFQTLLRNIGIEMEQHLETLIRVIDRKSQGDVIHYSEIASRMQQFGYELEHHDPEQQTLEIPNLLLLELGSLEHMKELPPLEEQLSSVEFFQLVTRYGEVQPFSDDQLQRLAQLFSAGGSIRKSAIVSMMEKVEEIMLTKGQEFLRSEREEENQVDGGRIKNVIIRLNGFEQVQRMISTTRNLYASGITQVKQQKDSGFRQLCLQKSVLQLIDKADLIKQYLSDDIQLIQAAVYTILSDLFATQKITPHLHSVKSEQSRISQLQMSLSGGYITTVPESQFLPHGGVESNNPAMVEVRGKLAATNERVRVQEWSLQALATICYDGTVLRQHLLDQVRIQSQMAKKNAMISKVVGIMEKKETVGTKISVVLEDAHGHHRLSDVIARMGGLIKIPSLVFSGQLVYVIKLWMSQILNLQCDILNSGYSLPLLRSDILFVDQDTGRILLQDLNGLQQFNHLGKYNSGIDVPYLVDTA